MTQAQPALRDDVTILCDVLCVARDSIMVKNRATGRAHRFSYDDILIGADKAARCYEIRMPRWLADAEGIRASHRSAVLR